MENKRIIYKIKSKYIIQNIFNYIKDSSIQLKLFIYSKYFQNKLNIRYSNYIEKYLEKIGFNLKKYLYPYEKEDLRKKYDNFILNNKFKKEKFEDILYEILENKKIKDIDEEEVINININKSDEKLIDINSPLFKIISKTKIFEKNFSIYISQNESKKDYIILFEKLNKSNIKYSSIYYEFNRMNRINNLKEFNIDYNKIKKVTLSVNFEYEIEQDIIKKNIYFFKTLFSINNIDNNLIYLNIFFKNKNNITPELFENINNFKSLKYLIIDNFIFNNNFTIKISNLKLLSCENCNNIFISDTFCKQLELIKLSHDNKFDINVLENLDLKELKIIDLSNNNLPDIKALEKVKFDKLEILNLSFSLISDINILKKVNFKELKEIYLSCNILTDINALEKIKFDKLEILDLSTNKISDINVLDKINFKELKEINLSNNNISDIKVLENVKFDKLETLNLKENNISDINILEKVKFRVDTNDII